MICLTGRSDINSFLALRHVRCTTAENGSGLPELEVENDGCLLAEENAASLERCVPTRGRSPCDGSLWSLRTPGASYPGLKMTIALDIASLSILSPCF